MRAMELRVTVPDRSIAASRSTATTTRPVGSVPWFRISSRSKPRQRRTHWTQRTVVYDLGVRMIGSWWTQPVATVELLERVRVIEAELESPVWALPVDPGRLVVAQGDAHLDADALLRRAVANRMIGRNADAIADLTAAERFDLPHPQRRWVTALRADFALHLDGDERLAWTLVSRLIDGPAWSCDAALAKAHEVRAQILAIQPSRPRLQQADRSGREAVGIWSRLGLDRNARAARANRATDVLVPLGRFDEALAEFDHLLAAADTVNESARLSMLRGFAAFDAGDVTGAERDLERLHVLSCSPLHPLRLATVSWGRALIACRRGDRAAARRHADRAERAAIGAARSWALPLWCNLSVELGAIGDLEMAATYLDRARGLDARDPLVQHAEFVLGARTGALGDVDAVLELIAPSQWGRTLAIAAAAASAAGATDEAHELARFAADELSTGGTPAERPVPLASDGRRYVRLFGDHVAVLDGDGHEQRLDGPTQRSFVAYVATHPGTTPAAVADALYPDVAADIGARRVRTVAKRVRDVCGALVDLCNGRFKLLADCDVDEVLESAEQAIALANRDHDMAGGRAFTAAVSATGPLLAEFTEPWADDVRAQVRGRLRPSLELLAAAAARYGDDAAAAHWLRRSA